MSELVAYPGLSAYEHWRLRHENASIGQSPGQSPCIDLLIMQPYPSKHLDATLQSLEKSPIWNVNSSFEALKEGNNLPFVLVTKAGEYVAEGAAERFIAALTSDPLVDLIYGDDDDLDKAGRRQNPRFKPDWNKDFFLAANFIGNTFVVRRTLLMKALDAGPCHLPGELLQRLVMHAPTPRLLHLPFILSHRRPEVPADATDELAPILWSDEEARSLSAGLQRQIPGISISRSNHGLLHVVWPLPSRPPLVSLIIPTRDHVDLLQSCLLSIRTKTDYPNLQFIVVDNGSTDTAALRYLESLRQEPDVKVLSAPGPFNFSRLNNLAVNSADGAVIGLVNNDIIALEPGWLREMVSHAIRPDVGAVGARLLYQNGLIQHAGMVCGIGLLTGHPHKFRRSDESGYMGRIMATQTLSAVTGACLVVEKAKYLSVGGLDEDHLPVAFNDVDLCLKLGEAGYRTIYTPYATLYHLESISRGFDTTRIKAEAYKREADFMARKWNVRVVNDPFYNPNLTRVREDFSYAD
ncbi:Glycosyltransferase, GT2 family [Xaviernesmea oryzae]|nr:Glycosyltransferase, GT2 family [Xaviernesmea oryzae]